MLKIKTLLLFFFIFQGICVFSQRIDRYAFVSGASMNSGFLAIESSIGELMSNTFVASSYMLSQGFVQNELLILNIKNEESFDAKVFPNPVSTSLSVVLNQRVFFEPNVVVYDLMGKALIIPINNSQSIQGPVYELDFSELKAGVYFVRISSKTITFNKVVKITKV